MSDVMITASHVTVAWVEERIRHYHQMADAAYESHKRYPTEGYNEEEAFMGGHEWAFREVLRRLILNE